MTSVVAPLPSPTATALLSALSDARVSSYFDQEERCIIAHPATVARNQVLDNRHALIDWEPFDSELPDADPALLRVAIWDPDRAPDGVVDIIYTTPVRRSLDQEAPACARAVAEWLAKPGVTAGSLLLTALKEYGITPGPGLSVNSGHLTDVYSIPVPFSQDSWGHLSIADRASSVRHVPAAHTGWSMFLHDERGEPVGDPVYITGTGGLVDCPKDSAALAVSIADWLTSPVRRHCDCKAKESRNSPHDRRCNRYRQP